MTKLIWSVVLVGIFLTGHVLGDLEGRCSKNEDGEIDCEEKEESVMLDRGTHLEEEINGVVEQNIEEVLDSSKNSDDLNVKEHIDQKDNKVDISVDNIGDQKLEEVAVSKEQEEHINEGLDDTEEVAGLLNPCKRSMGGGQLQKKLMIKAGYKIDGEMIKVHCTDETDHFYENGYYETIVLVDDIEMVVHALLPGQGLQPHTHDDKEDITVSYGELAYLTWIDGPGVPSNRTATTGESVGVEGGVTHAVFAGSMGAVYHEFREKAASRQTWFAPT